MLENEIKDQWEERKKPHLEYFKLFIFQVTQEYAFWWAGIVQKQLELLVIQ